MPLVLKICGSDWNNASRDKREMSVYRELGWDVLVMAKGSPKDKGRADTVSGFPVLRYSTRPLGTRVPNPVNRFVSLFQWAHYARQLHPDVISGHDLLPGMLIACMSALGRKDRPKLIYDAHEFELGRDAKRSALTKKIICRTERFVMKRCDFSIMVNDSIADEVQKNYRLPQRAVVVRSTPENWKLDPEVIRAKRAAFEAAFAQRGVHPSFLVMYHGGVVSGRGIELLIRAVSENPSLGLVILGNGSEAYLNRLRALSDELGVTERVLFRPAVVQKDLWQYVGAVDVDAAPIELVAKNHYFSLPNKFFESIQSLTPVITAEVPEMARIIRQYAIGLTFPAGDAEALGRCIEKMRTDKAFYAQCKENLKAAKADLCWEKEKQVLAEAFERYIGKPEN